MAKSSRIHGGETWSGLGFLFLFFSRRKCWMPLFTGLFVSAWTTTDIFLRCISPPACQCHRTPALHQRGYIHVVKPINNHIRKANKGDFSPKRIKTVNRRVNKSAYTVSLTSILVLINLINRIAMKRNRPVCQKLIVLGMSGSRFATCVNTYKFSHYGEDLNKSRE